jgi:beta-lactamase class A
MRKLLLAGVIAGMVGCGGAAPAPRPQPQPAVAARPVAAPAAVARPRFAGTPATPAGEQLAWILDVIVAHHGKLSRAEIEAHFHPTFLQQIPADKAVEIFAQMGAQLGQLVLGAVEGDAGQLVAQVEAGSAKLRIALAVDPSTQQISTLTIRGEVDAGPRPQSFDEVLRTVATLAPRAQLLVAELDKAGCHPLQELAATDELAIGSTFKLYVLLALADRIAAGKAAWTDELAIRDEWKSLPSGTTQNEPPGKKLPLSTLAERMISISDNTAADHLLYTLGRKDVEAAVRASRHARPALDAPFLSTRELFVFKLGTPAAELDRYLALPEAKRRAYLDRTLADKYPNLATAGDWTTARRVDTLEWFASSQDLCRAMAALWTRAQEPRTKAVLDVLAKNPGLAVDKQVWPYVGYKGGSEPGVLNMTYLLRRADDKWFVVTAGFNAAEGGKLDDARILSVVSGVIELLGATAAGH